MTRRSNSSGDLDASFLESPLHGFIPLSQLLDRQILRLLVRQAQVFLRCELPIV